MQKFGSALSPGAGLSGRGQVWLSGDGKLYESVDGTLKFINLVGFKYNSDDNPFTPEFFGCPVTEYQVAANKFAPGFFSPKIVPIGELAPGIPRVDLQVSAPDCYLVIENLVAISAPGYVLLARQITDPNQLAQVLNDNIQRSAPGVISSVLK